MTTNTEVLTVLKSARALISDPTHWCQHDFGRDKRGLPVDLISGEAYSFCSAGALRIAVGVKKYYSKNAVIDNTKATTKVLGAEDALLKTAEAMGFIDLVTLNDTSDHATVMKMFDTTIAVLSTESADAHS